MKVQTLILLSGLIESGKGFSYSVANGKFAARGYMASMVGKEFKYPIEGLNIPDVIETYCQRYRADLAYSNAYLGAWIEDGILYLDVSVRMSNIRAVKTFARQNGQRAIYDLKNQSTIYL